MKKTANQVIGGNAKVVRSINRSGILNIIREQQPISRISISKITGLNKSTVSSIVNELFTEFTKKCYMTRMWVAIRYSYD